MTSHTGGCACRQVRYELTAAPARMLNCHCRDCQRASGSAYAAILVVPSDGLRLRGELRYHAVTSERNTRIERGFCPTCGSPGAGMVSIGGSSWRAPHMSRWHAMESGPEETDRVAPAGPLRGSGNLTGPASSGPQDRGRVLRYRY
jgi:hypothetical protein